MVREWFREHGRMLLVVTLSSYIAINLPIFLIRWFSGKHQLAVVSLTIVMASSLIFYLVYAYFFDYKKWRASKAKSLLSK